MARLRSVFAMPPTTNRVEITLVRPPQCGTAQHERFASAGSNLPMNGTQHPANSSTPSEMLDRLISPTNPVREYSEEGADAVNSRIRELSPPPVSISPDGGPMGSDETDATSGSNSDTLVRFQHRVVTTNRHTQAGHGNRESQRPHNPGGSTNRRTRPDDNKTTPNELVGRRPRVSVTHRDKVSRFLLPFPPLQQHPLRGPHYTSPHGELTITLLLTYVSLPLTLLPDHLVLCLLTKWDSLRQDLLTRHPNLARAVNRLDWSGVEDGMDIPEYTARAMRQLLNEVPLLGDWEVFFDGRVRAPPVKSDLRKRTHSGVRRRGRRGWVSPGGSPLSEVWGVEG